MSRLSPDGAWDNRVIGESELALAAGLPVAPLLALLRASRYAANAGRPAWDFAIELICLVSLGLSDCDLRWLWCKGFVQHSVAAAGKHPPARPTPAQGSLQFCSRSLFVLTPAGARLVEQLFDQVRPAMTGNVQETLLAAAPTAPCWDQQLRELRVDTILIKRFCVPAENQELILAAFQEEDWPARIDDPLPPVAQIDAKRRLHSAIQCLNRNQRAQLVHFHGDGNGRGVRWEMRSSSPSGV